jgi:hypothetical protein
MACDDPTAAAAAALLAVLKAAVAEGGSAPTEPLRAAAHELAEVARNRALKLALAEAELAAAVLAAFEVSVSDALRASVSAEQRHDWAERHGSAEEIAATATALDAARAKHRAAVGAMVAAYAAMERAKGPVRAALEEMQRVNPM